MSPRIHRRAALGAILLLVVSTPPTPQAGDCAESGFLGRVHTVTPAPSTDFILEARGGTAAAAVDVRDTTDLDPEFPESGFVRHLAFDMQRGEFGFGFAPGWAYQCFAEAMVDERFVVEGLPPGAEVDLLVRLDIEIRVDRAACGSDCGLSVSSTVESPAGSDQRFRTVFGPVGPSVTAWSQDGLVPVHGGAEFAMRFGVFHDSPDHARSVETSARWSFPALAPGVSVRSCLAGLGPTPARAATWGALKRHYR